MDEEFEKAMNRELRNLYYSEHKKKRKSPKGNKVKRQHCPKCGKVCYSKVEAQTMVNATNRGVTNKKLKGYYYCNDCGHFHVTAKPAI